MRQLKYRVRPSSRSFLCSHVCHNRGWAGGSVRASGAIPVRSEVRRLDAVGLDDLLDCIDRSSPVAHPCRRSSCGISRHSHRVWEALPLTWHGRLPADIAWHRSARPLLLGVGYLGVLVRHLGWGIHGLASSLTDSEWPKHRRVQPHLKTRRS
jgi:hypothetical protein